MADKVRLPWLRITAESAAVVVSILLAFTIDALWDGRQATALESEWLAELEAEFTGNLENLEVRIQQNGTGLDHFEKFMRSTAVSLETAPRDTVDAWLLYFASAWTFDAARGASITLSDPAGLIAVRDPGIRRLVVDWLGLLADTQEEASSMWAGGAEVTNMAGLLGLGAAGLE